MMVNAGNRPRQLPYKTHAVLARAWACRFGQYLEIIPCPLDGAPCAYLCRRICADHHTNMPRKASPRTPPSGAGSLGETIKPQSTGNTGNLSTIEFSLG